MSNVIDLRKYQLKNEEDVIEFFKFVEARIPQALKIMKDQHLRIASLQNNVRHLRAQQPIAPAYEGDSNRSALSQLTNAPSAPVVSKSATHLEKMKAAAGPIVEPPTVPEPQTAPDFPPPPVAPGEIGSLNVKNIQPHPPTVKSTEAPIDNSPQTAPEPADNEIFAYDGKSYSRARDAQGNFNYSAGGQNISSDEYNLARGQAMPEQGQVLPPAEEEEIAADAGTSKSEHATDNDIQSENTAPEDQLSEDEKNALLNSAGPSEADKTPIGTSIARKTRGKTGTAKKK